MNPTTDVLRFGHESGDHSRPDERSVHWLLKRNCSLAPRHLLLFYVSLCAVSFAIAGFFWVQGVKLVMPFTWLEVMALGAALLVHARHANDNESIRLLAGRLTVEVASGSRLERVEFAPSWVRVEPAHGDRSLIEISGQGRRVSIGRFVRPELRRQLADELRYTLRRWQFSGDNNQSSRTTSPDPLAADRSAVS